MHDKQEKGSKKRKRMDAGKKNKKKSAQRTRK